MSKPKLPKEVSKFFSVIGSKGGQRSRRRLTRKEAKRIAQIRWGTRPTVVSVKA